MTEEWENEFPTASTINNQFDFSGFSLGVTNSKLFEDICF